MIHGASKNGHNLDTYVTEVLFGLDKNSDEAEQAKQQTRLGQIIEAVRSEYLYLIQISKGNNCSLSAGTLSIADVRVMNKNIEKVTNISVVKGLFEQLEKCRNQDNNPDSQA